MAEQKVHAGSRLSKRGWENVAAIMPKISAAVAEREKSRDDSSNTTSDRVIDLSTSENHLLRNEILDLCKEAIATRLNLVHLSYPKAFAGDPDLLEALCTFFNANFDPFIPVQVSHLATAPGTASCLDTLLYNIADPGEAVLVPGPYWNGFDFQFQARSSVTPVAVNVSDIYASLTDSLLPALENAFQDSKAAVKALVLTNPQNPIGQCYPRHVLEGCLTFCQKHDIHIIFDEVYGLTSFASPDLPSPTPFISALSLDVAAIGCDLSRVHVIWGISKDFGSNGIRIGCSITQGNKEMAVGLALASNTQTSSLAAVFATHLLTTPKLPGLIASNSAHLAASYKLLSGFFQDYAIPYIPSSNGLYIYAKLAARAVSWEDESLMVQKLKDAGVAVSAGRSYHGPEEEKGWMRVCFGLEIDQMKEAIKRMSLVLGVHFQAQQDQVSTLQEL